MSTFTADKVNKGSVRFAADDPKSPVKSLYVENEFLIANGKTKLSTAVDDKMQVEHELKVL